MIPSHIRLHQLKRELEVTFSDGLSGRLPCYLLRQHSRSAAHRLSPTPISPHVTITRIEMVGQYAVKLHFDDGHDSGIYSWSHLYDLLQAAV